MSQTIEQQLSDIIGHHETTLNSGEPEYSDKYNQLAREYPVYMEVSHEEDKALARESIKKARAMLRLWQSGKDNKTVLDYLF